MSSEVSQVLHLLGQLSQTKAGLEDSLAGAEVMKDSLAGAEVKQDSLGGAKVLGDSLGGAEVLGVLSQLEDSLSTLSSQPSARSQLGESLSNHLTTSTFCQQDREELIYSPGNGDHLARTLLLFIFGILGFLIFFICICVCTHRKYSETKAADTDKEQKTNNVQRGDIVHGIPDLSIQKHQTNQANQTIQANQISRAS